MAEDTQTDEVRLVAVRFRHGELLSASGDAEVAWENGITEEEAGIAARALDRMNRRNGRTQPAARLRAAFSGKARP